MRILRSFTIPQIMVTARIGETNLRKYIRAMERSGYLLRVRRNDSGHAGSFNQYRLIRDSGPKPPILLQSGELYDANLKTIFHEQGCAIHV